MKRSLDQALWAGQWILAIAYDLSGMIKLGLRAHHVHGHFGLAAETSTATLHAVGLVEVVIALLVILPALTRVLPQLSTAAAAGLGIVALVGTLSPTTVMGTGLAPANLALASLAAFVAWGRLKVPVAPLGDADELLPDPSLDAELPTAPIRLSHISSHP